jgi:hypothetical protein
MGFWYGDGNRRKNEIRAIIFSKRRGTILGSGRIGQEKGVIEGLNSIFLGICNRFRGRKRRIEGGFGRIVPPESGQKNEKNGRFFVKI